MYEKDVKNFSKLLDRTKMSPWISDRGRAFLSSTAVISSVCIQFSPTCLCTELIWLNQTIHLFVVCIPGWIDSTEMNDHCLKPYFQFWCQILCCFFFFKCFEILKKTLVSQASGCCVFFLYLAGLGGRGHEGVCERWDAVFLLQNCRFFSYCITGSIKVLREHLQNDSFWRGGD